MHSLEPQGRGRPARLSLSPRSAGPAAAAGACCGRAGVGPAKTPQAGEPEPDLTLAGEITLVRTLIHRLIEEDERPDAPLSLMERTLLVLKAMDTLARLLRTQAALTAQPQQPDLTTALVEALRRLGQAEHPGGAPSLPPPAQDGEPAAKGDEP